MFDRNITVKKSGSPQTVNKNVKIDEHRAPTDDSVKLLNEMQEKARQNLLKSVKIKDNQVEAIAMVFYEPNMAMESFDRDIHIRFKLNGKEYEIKETIDYDYYRRLDDNPHLIVRKVFENIAKAISEELIIQSDAFSDILEPYK